MGARLNAAIAAGQECIFCGDPVSSEEHVWPHWLKDSKTIDHTPVNHTQSQILVTVDPIGPDAVVLNTRKFDVKRRGGAATNRKEPVVCAPGNNGWMSRLEKKTKKILLLMIDDEPRNLDKDDQRTIARWADKVVMVWETTAPDIAVTTPEDRLRVMNESPVRPARRTQVWIGRTEHSPTITELRTLHPKFLHLGGNGETERVRVAVFVLGYVCLVVTSSASRVSEPPPVLAEQMSDRLTRIWPATSPSVHWPPSASMTSEDLEAARMSLQDVNLLF
jgi:hypothetical protein